MYTSITTHNLHGTAAKGRDEKNLIMVITKDEIIPEAANSIDTKKLLPVIRYSAMPITTKISRAVTAKDIAMLVKMATIEISPK